LRILLAAAVAGVLLALAVGFHLDGQPTLTQPTLFWCFVSLGLGGATLGALLGAEDDPHRGRRLLAGGAALLAWRVSYFPLLVLCGWLASVGEWVLRALFGFGWVYPSFLPLLFAANLAVGAVAAAAIAVPRGEPPSGRLPHPRTWLHRPPRRLLWALGALALPVAAMVSFSQPSDRVLWSDRPWREPRPIPPIHEPEQNPYARILREHSLGLASKVLALNAAITYPLVPEGPWGAAMKGTLEALALAQPIATSQERIDEHYLAYLAAHPRIQEDR
jgi:hypothetical protein